MLNKKINHRREYIDIIPLPRPYITRGREGGGYIPVPLAIASMMLFSDIGQIMSCDIFIDVVGKYWTN